MAASYIPTKLADLNLWANNFSTQCVATGVANGLSAPQVTAIVSACDDFNTKYLLSSTPATRTPVAVADTASSRADLLALVQPMAMILQNNSGFSDAERATYGLTIPSGVRTPVPTPTAIPDLSIQSISSGAIVLRAKTLGVFGNAKPAGSINVRIYRKSGATPPASIADATFIGILSKRFFSDDVSALAAGTQLWYVAVFATATGKVGPESSNITCNVSA